MPAATTTPHRPPDRAALHFYAICLLFFLMYSTFFMYGYQVMRGVIIFGGRVVDTLPAEIADEAALKDYLARLEEAPLQQRHANHLEVILVDALVLRLRIVLRSARRQGQRDERRCGQKRCSQHSSFLDFHGTSTSGPMPTMAPDHEREEDAFSSAGATLSSL